MADQLWRPIEDAHDIQHFVQITCCHQMWCCVRLCSVYRYINSLNQAETLLIHDLVFEVVRRHQRHVVISPWSLVATIFMQSRDGISVKQLVRESDWLKRQAQNFGAYVDWPGSCCNCLHVIYSSQHHTLNCTDRPTSVCLVPLSRTTWVSQH